MTLASTCIRVLNVYVHMNTEQTDDVIESLASVGVPAHREGPAKVVVDLDGERIPLELSRASVVSPSQVLALPARESASSIPLLVADRISAEARLLLTERGWAWLDLRGQVHLRAKGLFINASVPPRIDVPAPRAAGRVWREVCFALLQEPTVPLGVRALARRLEVSPAAVSGAFAQLRQASLLDRDDRPLVPELFWALAERWDVQRVALTRPPQPGDPDLELGLGASQGTHGLSTGTRGWVLTDTLAAAAYGAPIGVGSGWPPDFYVPDEVLLRRAVRVLGRADDWDARGATAAVPPVRQVCLLRQEPREDLAPGTHWLLADPLAVALDLAQDSSRGVEVLRDWTPPSWAARVWA